MNANRIPGRGITAAIAAGCLVAFIGFGFSAAFGVFLRPMSEELGWPRETFSLSLGLQALFWGFIQPFAGMVADRHGTGRVLAFGAVVSALGFCLRGTIVDPAVFVATGVVVGVGTGACSFPVVIVALGKIVEERRRSFILGLGTAAASAGMFAAAPAATALIDAVGWQNAILAVAASFLAILPPLHFIARASRPSAPAGSDGAFTRAIGTACSERGFVLLFFGFFVCGFHVAFIQTHLPAYVGDRGLVSAVGGWSLALIGLFNIFGSFAAGWSGQRYSKKRTLAAIYAARAVVIAAFVVLPLTPAGVYLFSAAMGVLWLSTVPLTTGLVAQTQGLRFFSTLVGLLYLGHQTGMFLGAWLGGRIFDAFGDYGPVWWAAVGLGVLAMVLHLPINELPRRLARLEAAGS
ncbi:MAG: MFS transporter [Rhodospirillales bacterium]|nr:MFS transporter [Rhodospirillales bacterium]